jgi:hypothetical protein
MENLISLFSYFVIISVAAERLTEIIKRSYLSNLSNVPGYVYQGISAVFGGGLAYISPPELTGVDLPHWAVIVITGLAVSGGSGFWNSVLTTMSEFGKARKKE